MSISIAQARSLLEGIYQPVNVNVNESSDKRKANVFFNLDKAASSNRITLKEARNLLTNSY